METACSRCGTLKTESVPHGMIYKFLWSMGYHLRRCSFCNRWRLEARGDRNRPHPNDLSAEELTEHFNRSIAASLRRDAARGGKKSSSAVAESIAKPIVADAAQQPVVKPAAVAAVATPPPTARPVAAAPVAIRESVATKPVAAAATQAAVEVADEDEEIDDYATCPKCGSVKFRRSRRRWYERWFNSPKMARCLKCSHRYPYPD